jgi:ATP-dependent protease ClpP protease subunit
MSSNRSEGRTPVMQKIKRRFELSVSPQNPDVTVMYLYGYVTDERWWDDEEVIATKEVREALLAVNTQEIHVHINSYGGYAFAGIAIHNLLKNHAAKVTCFVDGVAASSASVIAMAGDKIVMPANTMLMIHGASTVACGNAAELRKAAAELDKLNVAVTASYQSRFVGTDAELSALLETDTWLTAADALALGLCDEIAADAAAQPPPEPTPPEPTPPPEPPQAEQQKQQVLQKYGATNAATQNAPKPEVNPRISKCLEAFFNGLEEKRNEKS